MSLQEIAKRFDCTRQNIYYHLKRHQISTRDQSEAAQVALDTGRRRREIRTQDGRIETRTLHSGRVKQHFFRSWTRESAYVLGVIYSDGNLDEKHKKIGIGQKEPELLEKVRDLMGSNARISHTAKRGVAGAIYHLGIGDVRAYEDLLNIGLRPRKSKTIEFPDVPLEHARHFIRGCWDGDGSIVRTEHSRNYTSFRASYVSGSDRFIIGLVETLLRLGIPRSNPRGHQYESRRSAPCLSLPDSNRRIAIDRRSGAYYVYFNRADCVRLFAVFYQGVPAGQRLDRKYRAFREASEHTLDRNDPVFREEILTLRNSLRKPAKSIEINKKQLGKAEPPLIHNPRIEGPPSVYPSLRRRESDEPEIGCGHPASESRRVGGIGRSYCMACNRERAVKRRTERLE